MFLETAGGALSQKCGPCLRKSLWSWSRASSATTSTSSLWLGSTRAKTKVISSGTLHLEGEILTLFPFAWGEGTTWEKTFEFDLWEDKCRFNPHLISESGRKPKSEEMVLASVMNDVGNGNKDEVIILLIIILIPILFQFFFLSFSPLTSGKKDKNGRPFGNILATTRGNNYNFKMLKNWNDLDNFRCKIFWRRTRRKIAIFLVQHVLHCRLRPRRWGC